MARAAMGARLGIMMVAVGLLTAACAANPAPAGPAPSGELGTPSTGATAPSAPASTPGATLSASPSAQTLGERGTPGTIGTPMPTTPLAMMTDMGKFSDQLRNWAMTGPTPKDLMDMTDRASLMMADLQQMMPRMTAQERAQALAKMSALTGQMIEVVKTHLRQSGGPGQSGGWMGTPGPSRGGPGSMMGTPGTAGTPGSGMMAPSGTPNPGGMMAPSGTPNPMMTPAAGMIIPEQMMSQMDQMRDDMMRLWTGQPTHADLITMMSQMQTLLMVMSQQAGTLSPQDLQGLTNDMAQAIDDLARVMETHVQEETGLVPGAGASPTATAP